MATTTHKNEWHTEQRKSKVVNNGEKQRRKGQSQYKARNAPDLAIRGGIGGATGTFLVLNSKNNLEIETMLDLTKSRHSEEEGIKTPGVGQGCCVDAVE